MVDELALRILTKSKLLKKTETYKDASRKGKNKMLRIMVNDEQQRAKTRGLVRTGALDVEALMYTLFEV